MVHWNPGTNQYEGILWRQGEGSYKVGFILGEVAWKAKLTNDPRRLHESQMIRTGNNGVSVGFKWLEGELDLDRSNADELVSSFAKLRRIKN